MDTLKLSPKAVRQLIDIAGGPTALADAMGFPKERGRQRVGNWKTNGAIPAKQVRLHSRLLRRLMAKVEKARS